MRHGFHVDILLWCNYLQSFKISIKLLLDKNFTLRYLAMTLAFKKIKKNDTENSIAEGFMSPKALEISLKY